MPLTHDYYRERVLQVIQREPGISRSRLFSKTQTIDTRERDRCLEELLAPPARIRKQMVRPKRGSEAATYWPVDIEPTGRPLTLAEHVEVASRELAQAKQQLADCLDRFEAAMQRLQDAIKAEATPATTAA